MKHKILSNLILALSLILALGTLVISPPTNVEAQGSAPGLVLWNTLGSDNEVLNSAFGPNLEFYTGGSEPEVEGDSTYVPGVFGNAVTLTGGPYSSMDRIHNIVLNNLNNVIDSERGSIELWYYQTKSPVAYSHGFYRFFDGSFGLGSGMGFQATPDWIEFYLGFGATTRRVQYDIANIPNNEWVHLAASWDRNGIGGTSETIRLYVNNTQVSEITENDWGNIVGSRVDICGGQDNNIIDKFYMDNLRIWNYARSPEPESLVLWNKLGSQTEIENSEVGLGGTFNGGGFAGGMFGNAYSADYTQDLLVTFPKEAIPTDAGTIEFWAKLTGFPSNFSSGGSGHEPYFVKISDGYSNFMIGFESNDGAGNGGLCASVGHGFFTGTGDFGSSWTYEQILGVGQVEEWHHYALVWDKYGIPGVDDGTRKVAVFLDGELNSGRWYDYYGGNSELVPLTGGELGLIDNWGSQGSVAIDNLKIRCYAKTDFPDRFDEESPFSIVDFNSATYSEDEGVGTAMIAVTLSAISACPVTVNCATSDGTATTADNDYTAASSTLTFDPGVMTHTFPVDITDDVLNEDDEIVALTLSAPNSAALGGNNPATLIIEDNDSLPTVDFDRAAYDVGEGDGMATIAVTLSAASGRTVTVDYATSGGTATVGADYATASGSLTFSPGITSRTFPVVITDDALAEPNETVRLTLSNPDNAFISGTNPVTLTILDNDDPLLATIYLPIIHKAAISHAPDLVVDDLVATGDIVTVVIKNVGTAPVVDPFWVDVYLDPDPAPTKVNQHWWELSSQGLVWGVIESIPAGGTLTLVSGGDYYSEEYSNFAGALPGDTEVWAQVDSVNLNTTYGGVLETHEVTGGAYNNIGGPEFSTLSVTGAMNPLAGGQQPPVSTGDLPPRR